MSSTPFRTISSLALPFFRPDDLEKLYRAAQRFNIEKIRFTPGGQLSVSGVDDEAMVGLTASLKQFMQPLPENTIAAVSPCPGSGACKHGRRDTAAIAEKIQSLDVQLPLPAKVKIGIAGCRRCCTMPRLRDIGLVPAARGFNLYFGGNGGASPRISDCIGEHLGSDEIVDYIRASLAIYREHARPGMRTSRYIEQIGIADFREKLQKRLFP